MIYSYLDGRLGNILFEIAAGASLAKQQGQTFKAITCHPLSFTGTVAEYVKPFQQSILRKVYFQNYMPDKVEVYDESCYEYKPLPAKSNLILKGGYQSDKYFDKDLVRTLFEIDPKTESYIRNKYNDILAKKPVCINVRRGDYLLYEYKHPVCRMAFFKKAMSLFPPDTTFMIISDGIEWCKKHFKGKQFYFVDDEPPLVDLYLQSMCSHNIISNSTFSWWGAWLNPNPEKEVVYPSPWFMPYYKDLNTKDLCPEDWIAVPISGKLPLYCHAGYAYLKRILRRIGRICRL